MVVVDVILMDENSLTKYLTEVCVGGWADGCMHVCLFVCLVCVMVQLFL